MIKISGEYDEDDDEYGTDYDANDVDPENEPEISNDTDQDYDSDNATESGDSDSNDVGTETEPEISDNIDQDYDSNNATENGDSDSNDVDTETDSEISTDNDQDYDSDNATESGEEYYPFKCLDYNKQDPDYNRFKIPDYNKRDPDYNRFKFPDYGNKEEIGDERVESHTEEEQNDPPENLSGKEENIEEILEENSEPEIDQQEERVADSDSEIHEPKPEITSSVETENIGTEQSTISLQQQSKEQIPEHEPEDNEDIIELIDAEGNPSKSVESSEVLTIRKELEEMNLPAELENEPLNEHMLDSVPEQEKKSVDTEPIDSEGELLKPIQNEDEEINKILLDAEKMEWTKMEFRGEHASSHEEMEVEMLEEEMEELFNKYVEMGLEQLETSYELNQENHQEQQELEERLEEAYTQEQEEKITLEMERAQEQDEKENIKESSHTKIKENMQELSQELEQSNRKSQEIEQNIMQEVHQNIVQEEIQEQVEKQKELTLKKSTKFFKERYREETGGRPIYAGKETKGFIEWKEHLKEQGEKQKENDNLFREKKKETKEHSQEIRESKEEWAQYLENSIKEAEFSEEIKTELNEILEKYEQLRELLKNLKNKEISKETFEKEVKEFEYLLIEKRYTTRPLFMNFDWFRRYYNGRIKKSGKMVAHLYISNKTREFLSYISRRIEQLNNMGHTQENVEEFRELLEKNFQINEKWALLLNNLIHETPNEEISKEVKKELEAVIKTYCEIRVILFNKNILEVDKDKIIQERIEKSNPRFLELFEILKRFPGTHDNYSRKWMEKSLIFEGKKTIRQLSQKLKALKEEAVQEILNGDNLMLHKFKEILRLNLYKNTELNMNEKSKLIKIIQKKGISEEDRKVIKSLGGKLSERVLIFDTLKRGNLVLIINNDHWKIIIDRIIHIYNELEDGKWSVSISQFNINIIMDKIFYILKENYNGFSNYVDFNANSKRVFSQLIKMTPLILNDKNMKLVDLYKLTGHPIAKDLPNPYREHVKLFFETDALYRAKFDLKIREDFFEEYKLLAEERGWVLLSEEYINNKIGLDFKCLKCNHEWHVTPNSLKDTPSQKGRGCPQCSQRLDYIIADMQRIASERGGWCLSEDYINNHTRLKWKCGSCDHEWRATPKSIMISDSWCPQCAEGLYKRMCRVMFEEIFHKEFNKSYPSWLISEKGFQMHLDGDNEDLCLSFEWQGEQHYRFIKFIHKTNERFHAQQKLDIWKQKKCNENGRILIKIGFELINGKLHKIRFNEIEDYIRKKCIEQGIIPPTRISKIDWRTLDISPPDKIQEMVEIAKSRNGFCLSKNYFGVHIKLLWKCKKCNNEWWATPHNIKAGHWCKICGIQNMIKNRHLNSLIKNKF